MYSIYALADPRDGAIRYVGYSNNVERRYQQHGFPANDNTTRRWVSQLAEQGLKPILLILEEVDTWDLAWRRESYWIDVCLIEGEPLVNQVSEDRRKRKIKEQQV